MSRIEVYNSLEEHRKLMFILGAIRYDDDTEEHSKPIAIERMRQYTDFDIDCLFSFLQDSDDLDMEKNGVAFNTLMNLLDVFGERHPIDEMWLEASKAKGFEELQRLIDETK